MELYLYIYTARLLMSVFLYLLQAYMPSGRPANQHTSHRRPRPRLSGACRQGLQQPTNMQPGTFCYR